MRCYQADIATYISVKFIKNSLYIGNNYKGKKIAKTSVYYREIVSKKYFSGSRTSMIYIEYII